MVEHSANIRTYGFEPLLCNDPKILILGTLPGGESLAHKQYYYSNSNRIWKVLCKLTGESMPANYQHKKALLAKYHIVLWDYYESAIRPDSSNDKDIRDGRPNDIVAFMKQHPTIKVIAINGFGKYKDFGAHIKNDLARVPDLVDVKVLRLPETSGSNKNYGWGDLDKLSAEWAQIFDMADIQAPQPDYDAIAKQAYEWLKKMRVKGEISTYEVLMKINGYKWGSKELEELEEMDLFEVHNRLLRLIKKEKEYIADFSAYKDMYVGLPYDIPFVFRKK